LNVERLRLLLLVDDGVDLAILIANATLLVANLVVNLLLLSLLFLLLLLLTITLDEYALALLGLTTIFIVFGKLILEAAASLRARVGSLLLSRSRRNSCSS
jgi:hypothetical protein